MFICLGLGVGLAVPGTGCRGVGDIGVSLCAWACQEGVWWLSVVCRDVSVCPTLNWGHF